MAETQQQERASNGTAAQREMQQDDDRSIREWMDALAGEGSLRVQITRKKPSVGPNGESIAGILETVDDRIDDDYLRDTWGGGQYQLKIFRLNGTGNWVYLRARTIAIAGPPKMSGVALTPHGSSQSPAIPLGNPGSDELVDRAMSALERSTARAEARMERLEQERHRGAFDHDALDSFLSPMRDELNASRAEARELRAQLYEAANRPPPRDEFRDRLMERMIDGESARVESVRTQYEARIDRLRDAHADDIKRLEGRHEDAMRRAEKAQEREIEASDKAHAERTEALRVGYEMRIDTLRGQIAALERDLAAAQSKIGVLEAKKDQSLPDKAAELLQIREALDGIGGGGGGGDKKWYEKAIDALGNSDALVSLVNRVSGGPGGEQPQPQALPPPGVPFQGPDGQIYVIGPDGRARPVQRRALTAAARAKRGRALAAPAAPRLPRAEADAKPDAEPDSAQDALDGAGADGDASDGTVDADPVSPVRAPDAREVKIAVTFLENAVRNNTAPEQFASAFRTLVPADVVRFIRQVGIDAFLNEVVEPTSPLATQRGRQFARAVTVLLVGGTPA